MAFLRPIGAVADTKELEYVAALHQTAARTDGDFKNGSIDARDIKYYLISRYGISVTKDEVCRVILNGLGGIVAVEKDESISIDLVEVVSILIIPLLLKVSYDRPPPAQKTKEEFFTKRGYRNYLEDRRLLAELEPSPTVISDVLGFLLLDVFGVEEPPKLTKGVIKTVLAKYNEYELAQDDALIEEMISAAVGSGHPDNTLLDKNSFARALTADVKLYDVEKETRQSTFYEDVFGVIDEYTSPMDETEVSNSDDLEDHREELIHSHSSIKRVFTFPSIDFMAETFRSRGHVVIVWLSLYLGYYLYFFGKMNLEDVCYDEGWGCLIGKGVFRFTIIMLVLAGIGPVYVVGLCSGNNIFKASVWEILLGIISVGLFIFFPAFYQFDATVFSTYQCTSFEGEYIKCETQTVENMLPIYGHILCGGLLLVLQFIGLIRVCIPKEKLLSNKFLSKIFTGSNAKAEAGMKQAACFKVNRMIKNAHELHLLEDSHLTKRESMEMELLDKEEPNRYADALLAYTGIMDDREEAGGVIWAWKHYFSGDLLDREGIWLHTRLVAGNLSQFLVAVLTLFGACFAVYPLLDFFAAEDSIEDIPSVDSFPQVECDAFFDPDDCSFPTVLGNTVGIGICYNMSFSGSECEDIWEPLDEYTMDLCDMYSEVPGWNLTESCSSLFTTMENKTIYAYSHPNGTEEYCYSPIFVCQEMNSSSSCVIGIDPDTFAPFSFSGESCQQIGDLKEYLESVESGLEFLVSLIPKKWMVVLSFTMGLISAFVSTMFIATMQIPSTISTILKYRSGVFPSLRDPAFSKMRTQIEDITFLLGLMFWGALFSFGLVLVFVTLFVFVLVWQVTRQWVFKIIGGLIGTILTILFKIILVKVLGKLNYAAYYRKRPAIGNIASVALECWHLGITVLYMIARVSKILMASMLLISRVDTPILAEGAVGSALDSFPYVYRKELLAAEAHRHPYIEQLGMMYLMKLRYGDEFAKPSGSIWRLLFVFALMPWLRKDRNEIDQTEEAQLAMSMKRDRNRIVDENFVQNPNNKDTTEHKSLFQIDHDKHNGDRGEPNLALKSDHDEIVLANPTDEARRDSDVHKPLLQNSDCKDNVKDGRRDEPAQAMRQNLADHDEIALANSANEDRRDNDADVEHKPLLQSSDKDGVKIGSQDEEHHSTRESEKLLESNVSEGR